MKCKGFTLVEILGVIVILGLLLLLAAPSITNKFSSMATKTNEIQKNTIYEATEQYIADNTDIYPKNDGDTYCVSLEELIDNGNLKEGLVDVATKEKYDTNMQVKVTIDKNGNADYELVDSNDKTCIVNKTDILDIEINPGNDTWSSKKTATIKYPALDITNDTNYSYCYIKNNEREVCTNKSTIKVEFTENGTITAYVKVNNSKTAVKDKNNKIVTEIKSDVKKIDGTRPICNIEFTGKSNNKVVSKDNNSIWYTGNITIKATYSDGEASDNNSGKLTKTGLSPQEYKGKAIYNNKMGGDVEHFTQTALQTKDTDGTVWYCYVKDKAGNETYNKVTLYKDSQPPLCEINFEGDNNGADFKNDNSTSYVHYDKKAEQKNDSQKEQWYTGNVKITLSKDDIKKDNAISGIAGYKLSSGIASTSVIPSNNTLTQTEDTTGTIYYGFVQDEAGNTSTCSRTVVKDSTKPTCELDQQAEQRGNLANGTYYWWVKGDVEISFKNVIEETSGIKNKGISSVHKASYANATGSQKIDTKDFSWYGYVMDKAGNTNECNTLVYRDTEKPTCEITATGRKGNNNWYIDDVTIGLTTKDNTSGIDGKGMRTQNVANYNNVTEVKLTEDTKGTTYYGFVKDYAGNTNTCSKTIKRNTTPPSCNLTYTGKKGNNDWYVGNITVKLNYDKNAPATITNYGLTNVNKTTYNSKSTVTQTADTVGVKYYGFVKDEVGRTAKCETPSLKKDSSKPKLGYELIAQDGNYVVGNAYNNQWCNHTVKRVLYPSDSFSGVKKTQYQSEGRWYTETNVNSYYFNNVVDDTRYRVIDNAGNVSDELHLIIKSDWYVPTISTDQFTRTTDSYHWASCNLDDALSGIPDNSSWNRNGRYYYEYSSCGSSNWRAIDVNYRQNDYFDFAFWCGAPAQVVYECYADNACDIAGNCMHDNETFYYSW